MTPVRPTAWPSAAAPTPRAAPRPADADRCALPCRQAHAPFAAGLGAALRQQLGAIGLHVALVGLHGAALDEPQPVRRRVDQMPVVADQDHRALILAERAHQRLAAVDVEVVGRLVEDDQMRRMKRRQHQHQPRFLAARQRAAFGARPSRRRSHTGRAWRGAALRCAPASGR